MGRGIYEYWGVYLELLIRGSVVDLWRVGKCHERESLRNVIVGGYY